jgi:hypothetical protein
MSAHSRAHQQARYLAGRDVLRTPGRLFRSEGTQRCTGTTAVVTATRREPFAARCRCAWGIAVLAGSRRGEISHVGTRICPIRSGSFCSAQ